MPGIEDIRDKLIEFNNNLENKSYIVNDINERTRLYGDAHQNRVKYEENITIIQNKTNECNNIIDVVGDIKVELEKTLNLANEIKNNLKTTMKLANSYKIGTLEGLARSAIRTNNIDTSDVGEGVTEVLRQPYNEREQINNSTGGKRKNKKRNTKKNRKTSKKNL